MELIGKTHRQLISFDKDIGHLYVPNIKARIIDSEVAIFLEQILRVLDQILILRKKKKS